MVNHLLGRAHEGGWGQGCRGQSLQALCVCVYVCVRRWCVRVGMVKYNI